MFTVSELEAIVALVEDAYPILEIMKRRTGASISSARAIYAGIEAKASAEIAELRKPKKVEAPTEFKSVD